MPKRLLALALITALGIVIAPALISFGFLVGIVLAWLTRGLGKI